MPKELTLPRGTLPKLLKKTALEGVQGWEVWVEGPTPEGFGVMVIEYGLIDGAKQLNRETIKEGKRNTTPYQQAVLEAKARWEKQKKRKGYGLTYDESADKRALSPMLAKVYAEQAKKVDWDHAWAQRKYNGFRCLIRRVNGDLLGFSREGQVLMVPHILAALEDVVDDQTVLDGELYKHGMSLNKISKACKRDEPVDLTFEIQYHAYDTMSSLDYLKRQEKLQRIITAADTPLLVPVETKQVTTHDDLMTFQRQCIEDGFEGAMLRHGEAGYEAGKRSATLLKVKSFEDAEFKIVGYETARGKYEGVPIFICETDQGHPFGVLAPGSMGVKKAFGEKADDFIGKQIKVKYPEYTKTEKPVPFQPVAMFVKGSEALLEQVAAAERLAEEGAEE